LRFSDAERRALVEIYGSEVVARLERPLRPARPSPHDDLSDVSTESLLRVLRGSIAGIGVAMADIKMMAEKNAQVVAELMSRKEEGESVHADHRRRTR